MENKKIKVSFLISGSEIGGTEKMLIDMAERLPRDDFFPPVVFAIRGSGTFTIELRKRGIKVHIFDMRRNPFRFFSLLLSVRRESPDVLHSFLFYGNLAGRICGRLLGIKAVISSQRSTDDWRKKIHWLADGLTAKWADAIISNSHSGKRALVNKAGIKPSAITVIPNGIELPPVDATFSRGDFGIRPGELVVGTVGNLRKPKGHIYLVLAAPLVLEKLPDTRFMIVGQGELQQYLLDEAKKAGVAEKFVFTGFIKDAAKIIRLFDVFAFPSLWEGCPVGLLEAMGAGKPCVAFPAGDVPFIIDSGKNGIIVRDRSHEELAQGILKLLGDRNLREETGRNARKRVEESFTFEGMMEQYVSVYRTTVAMKAKNG